MGHVHEMAALRGGVPDSGASILGASLGTVSDGSNVRMLALHVGELNGISDYDVSQAYT